MCNRYISPSSADLERAWHLKSSGLDVTKLGWPQREVFPRGEGAFIRQGNELVPGVWGLIPWFAKTSKLTYSTNNCRIESVATAPSFKQSWLRGQRCIIPAIAFFEPCWETGKNVWWRFTRADGELFSLAGVWNTWLDKASGELVESYTMLTMNADTHPIMKRMHKPDPKFAPNEQDKRSVVVIEKHNVDDWLHGSLDDAQAFIQLAPDQICDARPLG